MDAVGDDLKTEWVRRVLGYQIPNASTPAPPGLDAAELRGELNRLGLQVSGNKADPAFAALAPVLRSGIEALKAGDLAAAQAAAASLGESLARLQPAARAREASGEGPSVRLLATLSLSWRRALSSADSELAELKEAVLAAAEDDDELDEDDVQEIADQLDNFDDVPLALDGISSSLADLVAAEGPARAGAIRALLADIGDTRTYLRSDAWVASLHDVGVTTVSFVDECLGVLDELEAAAA